jgi:DNA-binding FrmR family transcriptional regulator
MKTIKISVAMLLCAVAFSCKQGDYHEEEAPATEEAVSAADAGSGESKIIEKLSKDKVPDRKLVRTADIKFKVKNVAQSTYAIENAVNRYGGLITNNNLQSHISETNRSKVSRDSILETSKYVVENNITLRIPNRSLDTVVKAIAKEIQYLDYRVIKADDVALQMLSNQLAQQRNANHNTRLANSIDSKGKKLNQIADAEENLLGKNENSDIAAIQNLSLQDQVNYSTITLAMYQNETLHSEMVAIAKTGGDYGNFGLEIWDGIKNGWFILERIIAFVVQLWSVVLIGGIALFVFRRYLNKKKPAIF